MSRALIVIDMQESFRVEGMPPLHDPDIAATVGRLVEASRAAGDLVVWVLHSDPGSDSPFDPDAGAVRVMSELQPADGEPVVVKTSINAFTTTNLQQQLVSRGVREVVVCGIRTDQCCETTARVASDLGFDVVFVTDATTTSDIPGLAAADVIARTEAVLRAREFARIATTAELLGAAV